MFTLLDQWKLTDLTVKNTFYTDWSVKIDWFNSEKYCPHWWMSEKANHWFN